MAEKDEALIALMTVMDTIRPIADFVIGYRRTLIQGGYDETTATHMAAMLHQTMVLRMLTPEQGESREN